jgi:hypothetical protein
MLTAPPGFLAAVAASFAPSAGAATRIAQLPGPVRPLLPSSKEQIVGWQPTSLCKQVADRGDGERAVQPCVEKVRVTARLDPRA